MEMISDFMRAAWVWMAMGILLAIFFALYHVINEKRKKSGKKDCSSEGIAYGMCFGLALGIALQINIGVGIMIGMIVGLFLGSKKEKKTKENKNLPTVILLLLVAGWQTAGAQDISKFKILNDSAYLTTKEYQTGNKYQKDAILFMDMVADTHPYYFKAERRAQWLAKKQALLEHCKTIVTDEAFVDTLIKVLGPLHDKHTDLTTLNRMQEGRLQKEQTAETNDVPGDIDLEHIMRRHNSFYDYSLFPDYSICYLQFNQCMNAADYPFADFLNDMFAKIEENGIRTLVVDAQYNNGGSSQLCDELLLHLYPISKMNFFSSYLRFSDLMAAYNPRIAVAKKNWEDDGHKDELYQMPAPKIPADYQQPTLFDGKVVFVMGKRTFSSAGMLFTMARDNHIGTIIGTTSTFSPSHYGEVLPYRLPNTGVLGSISCKFFARPDTTTVDDNCMEPDVKVNLDEKDAAWQFIINTFGNK